MNKGLQAIFFVRIMYLLYITVNQLCYSFEVCIQVGKKFGAKSRLAQQTR